MGSGVASPPILPGARARSPAGDRWQYRRSTAGGAGGKLDPWATTDRAPTEEVIVELHAVPVDKPEDMNVIIGQSHFIKTIEDVHEALAGSSPHLRFGVAFCEASGPCLVRSSGNDDTLTDLAVRNASAIGAGHSFVVFLDDGYPVNVLNALKMVPEVCQIFCASANPVEVLVAETDLGRGIVGVIDGSPPAGVESDADRTDRKALLRTIGYKL